MQAIFYEKAMNTPPPALRPEQFHPQARPWLCGRPFVAHRGRLPRRICPRCALGCSTSGRLRCGVRGVSGFRIHAGHFAERHGLVVIITLGESIVAAGVGVSGMVLGAGVIVAVVVGIALAAALWLQAA